MSIYAKTIIGVFGVALSALWLLETNPFGFSDRAAEIANLMVLLGSLASLALLDHWGITNLVLKYTGIRWLWSEVTWLAETDRIRDQLRKEQGYHHDTYLHLAECRQTITNQATHIGELEQQIRALNDVCDLRLQRFQNMEEQCNRWRNEAINAKEELTAAKRLAAYYKGDANKHRRMLKKPALKDAKKPKVAA